ncbi:hypothetical protein N5J75_01495 [Pantoea brenneri]|nr:hypothetical protein [Pantoea brenneri]MDH2121883.1 hypothetical protein [Pantoea brenneri]
MTLEQRVEALEQAVKALSNKEFTIENGHVFISAGSFTSDQQ